MKSTEGAATPEAAEGRADRERLFGARDLALGGLLGALAIALPVLFHALGPGVGPILLPMYLPILALGLLASWRTTVLVGLIAPLLSAVLTGMPPLAPPVALLMAAELAALAGVAGAARRAGLGVWPACVLALVGSRLVGTLALLTVGHTLGYNRSVWEYAVLSLGVAWPGMLLQLTVVPAAVALVERTSLLGSRFKRSAREP